MHYNGMTMRVGRIFLPLCFSLDNTLYLAQHRQALGLQLAEQQARLDRDRLGVGVKEGELLLEGMGMLG